MMTVTFGILIAQVGDENTDTEVELIEYTQNGATRLAIEAAFAAPIWDGDAGWADAVAAMFAPGRAAQNRFGAYD